MRKVQIKLMLLIAFFATTIAACKKDSVTPSAPGFSEYSLEVAANPDLESKVTATIEGTNVYIRVPNVLDITSVVPSFTTKDPKSIVYVGDQVQESGITPLDFSQESIEYRIITSTGASTYNVYPLRKAAIVAFGFYAEDNDGVLFKDYPATVQGLNIAVNLPADADITKLVARFTTSAGAVVKVGGQVQESQVSELDFTKAVSFAVTDAETATPQNYVVTVGRLTAPEWSQITASVLDSAASVRLAINPVTHNPYVIYNLTTVAAGNVDANRKAVAAYFENGQWNFLGATKGFSGARVDAISLAFDTKGTLYAAYKDIESGNTWHNKPSVQKYANDSWSYVGDRGISHAVNYLDIAVGANDVPVIGYTVTNANAPLANRAPYYKSFSAGQWSAGSGIGDVATAFFSRTFAGDDGFVYYVAMDMTSGTTPRKPSLYKLVNENWALVGPALAAPVGEDVNGDINIDAVVAEDGTPYIAYQNQVSTGRKTYVLKLEGNTWKKVGDEILHEGNLNTSALKNNIALAIHPNGILYFAYSDLNGVKVTTFNPDTYNWNTPVSLSATNGDKLDLKISKDGIPYLATVINSKVAVFKYDIPAGK